MTFHFKCQNCGRELQVDLKLVMGGQVVELAKNLKVVPIEVNCPKCGHKGAILIQHSGPALDRLTHLKYKNARNPCMN